MTTLFKATLFAVATLTAPVAHAAAPMGFGPSTVDVLINRPSANAEIISVGMPSVASLIRLNMRIWGCVGWQWGRLETIKKYGIDIGARCPR